jgi:hypothetical protein
MDPIELVLIDGRIEPATRANKKVADAVLKLDPNKLTDGFALVKLAEAIRHYSTQNSWPPQAMV